MLVCGYESSICGDGSNISLAAAATNRETGHDSRNPSQPKSTGQVLADAW